MNIYLSVYPMEVIYAALDGHYWWQNNFGYSGHFHKTFRNFSDAFS